MQAYDVTGLLSGSVHELYVTVGRGWFRSPMPGWLDSEDKRRRYTQPCGLIAALTLSYADGTSEIIRTDESWEAAESAVRFSEIYDGECYDACFGPTDWRPVMFLDWPKKILIPQEGEVIREIERIPAKTVIHTPAGETLIDFGQEVTGYVEFSVTATPGSAAWGDAAVICPWKIYQTYGDEGVLADQFESMKKWVDYIGSITTTPDLWTGGTHFGDWLGLDAPSGSYKGSSREDFIASAFYAYSVSLLVKAGKHLAAARKLPAAGQQQGVDIGLSGRTLFWLHGSHVILHGTVG